MALLVKFIRPSDRFAYHILFLFVRVVASNFYILIFFVIICAEQINQPNWSFSRDPEEQEDHIFTPLRPLTVIFLHNFFLDNLFFLRAAFNFFFFHALFIII